MIKKLEEIKEIGGEDFRMEKRILNCLVENDLGINI